MNTDDSACFRGARITCEFPRYRRSTASPELCDTASRGRPAAGLRPRAPPPAPEWSLAAAALMRGRSLAAEAADWAAPCGGGWWGEGWRWETGRGRSHAETEPQTARLWEEFNTSVSLYKSHNTGC